MSATDLDVTAIDWAAAYEHRPHSHDKAAPGSDESRAFWDAKAAGFAKKPQRSDYLFQLMELLNLKDGETVFDMGCGSGTLSVPLAQAGHDVIAVDFSTGMLGELEEAAARAGVAVRWGDDGAGAGADAPCEDTTPSNAADGGEGAGTESAVPGEIVLYRRSWQEPWDGLPVADVAVSSRSFVTDDLADGVAKLETQARRRVVLTCGAGDLPYRDARVLEAMGRAEEALMPPAELMIIANYLWARGRFPRIDYIEYPGVWHRKTREEMEETVRAAHVPRNGDEEAALAAFLDEHIVQDEGSGWWQMDYPRQDRWAVIQWDV